MPYQKTDIPSSAGPQYGKVSHSVNNESIAGKHFHFIGIGGVGMSGLARIMLKQNAVISGSDQNASDITKNFSSMGCKVSIGQCEENLSDSLDAVVISAAIKPDNPELILAIRRGLKVYKYAQMLGLICERFETIAIAGTHGKSTTAGWLISCLKHAGIDPNYVIGAQISDINSSCDVGTDKHFIVEACEFDRSFLNLKPKIACILNIEADHLDYYKDEQEIVEAFTQFALNAGDQGIVIANGMDPNVCSVISKMPSWIKVIKFGLSDNCDYSARNIELIDGFYSFDIYRNGHLTAGVRLSQSGRHNILNALAMTAMADQAGVNIEQIALSLSQFTGIDRRVMLKDKINGITILDDYAHHPTEIKASLEAVKQQYNPNRVICVFQPHQYSRTRFLLDDFAESFKLANLTIVPEIYFVRDTQKSKKQVTAEMLVEKIVSSGSEAVFIDSFEKICQYLQNNVTEGDLILTMGAGDVWKVADEYIQWLRTNS